MLPPSSAPPSPAAEELLSASDEAVVEVGCSHGPHLTASIASLLHSSPLAPHASKRALARKLVLLLPAFPQLEPFLVVLCEQVRPHPLRLTPSTSAHDAASLLQALSSLCEVAPHLGRPPFVLCSELLPLVDALPAEVGGHALRLLALSLRLADAPRARLLKNPPAEERRGHPGMIAQVGKPATAKPNKAMVLPPGVVCLEGELHCSLRLEDGVLRAPDSESTRPSLVQTDHLQKVMRTLGIAMSSGAPILLSGPSGSGKTALLMELAAQMGQREGLVRIHMDEQIDSKVLLGTYVCTEQVGEFKWQPGVVAQAVAQGRWLVLEDVDRAPMEVMASLSSLIESRCLYLPGRATTLHAPSSFRLWASLTAQPTASGAWIDARVFRCALWQRVRVPPMASTDLARIIGVRHPLLSLAASAMVRTLVMLLEATGSTFLEDDGGIELWGGVDRQAGDGEVDAQIAEHQLESVRCALGGGRTYSSRDLLKWAARCEMELRVMGLSSLPPPSDPQFTSHIRETILLEALDTFVCAVRRKGPRQQVAEMIAQFWQVPPERLHYLLHLQKPSYVEEPVSVRVGRVVLIRPSGKVAVGASGVVQRFANTRHTLAVMERVAACVRMCEPVLLVGETGTGKTTVVQKLANSLGRQMLVCNLSEQSDSAELLGGFRPVQTRHVMAPLTARFEFAFVNTFSRSKNAAFLQKVALRLARSEWARLLSMMASALKRVYERTPSKPDPPKRATALEGASPLKKQRGESGVAIGSEYGVTSSQERADGTKRDGKSSGPTEGEAEGRGLAISEELRSEWEEIGVEVARLQRQLARPEEGIAFSFVEGSLVRALRAGDWILLDEINLAAAETLERIAAVLEENGASHKLLK